MSNVDINLNRICEHVVVKTRIIDNICITCMQEIRQKYFLVIYLEKKSTNNNKFNEDTILKQIDNEVNEAINRKCNH